MCLLIKQQHQKSLKRIPKSTRTNLAFKHRTRVEKGSSHSGVIERWKTLDQSETTVTILFFAERFMHEIEIIADRMQ